MWWWVDSGFHEEGPFAEFNKGKMGKKDNKGGKRRNNAPSNSTPEKKSKLTTIEYVFAFSKF